MELAQALNIKGYPAPAGGCLLTEKVFSRRLKDLFFSQSDPDLREIELLKVGRHFRIFPHTKLVVGRNKSENEEIHALTGKERSRANISISAWTHCAVFRGFF